MNLNTLRDRCETRFRDTSNAVVSSDEWVEYLNDVYAFINAATPDWPVFTVRAQTLTVLAGAEGVELSEDVWQVNSVYNTLAKAPLMELHGPQTAQQYFVPGDSGEPFVYRVSGNFLEVYPSPVRDTDLSVEWAEGPAELASGTDEPWFPERFHRMMVSGALALAYEDDGNLQQAQSAQSRLDVMLEGMKESLLRPQGEGYHVIQDSWDY